MPDVPLIRSLLLPELSFIKTWHVPTSATTNIEARKQSSTEICPRCATPSSSIYDTRRVTLKDEPIRNRQIKLHITKRRFSCRPCAKPFTEPVPGVKKGARTTQRFKASLLWACENFADLSSVLRAYRCSSGLVYKALYEQLEHKRKSRQYPWPSIIGIDEHFFRHDHKQGFRQFVSMVVDFNNRRLFELVHGRSEQEMIEALSHIQGRENVRHVALDLCDPFKNFAKNFFPNASLVADKFHVLRLLVPAINRRRKAITGDRRSLGVRRMLLRSGKTLSFADRSMLHRWLGQHPELQEVYHFKEAMHGLYRVHGQHRAAKAFTAMTDRMAHSSLHEIQTLRRTLLKWRKEILAYFKTRITNARTEGFNNKAKVVKRRAYGYRSFNNYRLRLLNACA